MLNEKRRFTRIGFKMSGELTVADQVFRVDQISNLSVGGCSLGLGVVFDAGTACRFWVPLDPAHSELGVDVQGEIVRCDGQYVSIRFTSIDPDSLFHLQNIIRYNALDADQIEAEIIEHPGLR